MARAAFSSVMAGLAIAFFLIGQATQNGGRVILSQTFYLLACVFGACFVVAILPGRSTPPQK